MKKILLLGLLVTSTFAYCFGWRFGITPRFNAVGGTISTANSYRIHTYLADGTFQVTSGQATIEYLVIGGGGGGSSSGGGGGAGGYVAGSKTVGPGTYSVIVGLGGQGGNGQNVSGSNGGDSSAIGLLSIGGGGAGDSDTSGVGKDGGSGGGTGHCTGTNQCLGGKTKQAILGTATGIGFDGGSHLLASSDYSAGAGGGAGGVGGNTNGNASGTGGPGLQNAISGILTWYAAGGGAGGSRTSQGGTAGAGGSGIGGNGSATGNGTAGFDGTGSGGGGAWANNGIGGNGGKGIVILRYIPVH